MSRLDDRLELLDSRLAMPFPGRPGRLTGADRGGAIFTTVRTHADVIAAGKIHEVFDQDIQFELFREDLKPPVADLCDRCRQVPEGIVPADL